MLRNITPVVLTYNESSNITRTLERLNWAADIVIVDSFSEDDTVAIAQKFSQSRIFRRQFDSHEKQWNYAISETGISTEWLLALDADYVLTPQIIQEIEKLEPRPETSGYRAHFVYCVGGYPLRGSAYPPVTVLYRRNKGSYRQDGHTQRLVITGKVEDLNSPILHDDRKPLRHWLRAQERYSELEANTLLKSHGEKRAFADRVRSAGFIAPFLMFFYCMFVKRAVLDGWPGLYYAFQRLLAESLLSLRLIEDRVNRNVK